MFRSTKVKQMWLGIVLLCLFIGVGQASAIPQQQQLSQIVAPTNLTISIHTPAGWQFQTVASQLYTSLLATADSGSALQAVSASLANGTALTGLQGNYAIVGIFNPALYLGLNIDVATQAVFQNLTSAQSGVQVVASQNQTFAGGVYRGWIAQVNVATSNLSAFISAFTDGNTIIVAVVGTAPAANFQTMQPQMLAMLQSVRVPAEPGAITTPPQIAAPTQPATPLPALTVATPALLPTTQPSVAGATTLVKGGGDALSLELPSNWVFEDHIADAKVLAYGSSADAMHSRLASAHPELAAASPITGSGGLVILYNPADLGLGASYDGTALMNRVLTNIKGQGFQVNGDIQVLQMDQGPLLYAIVTGPENGFLALAFVNGQIAYITATGDAHTFAADQNLLFDIMRSVHVPAASSQGGGSLGNPFGGGNSPTATPGSGLGLPLATPIPPPTQSGGHIVPAQTATPAQGGGHIVPILPTATS